LISRTRRFIRAMRRRLKKPLSAIGVNLSFNHKSGLFAALSPCRVAFGG
jgi:hypothetical protein